MAYEDKLKSIRTKFKSMIGSNGITRWTNHFHFDKSNFENNLGAFDSQNLNKLFKHIYEKKETIFVIIYPSDLRFIGVVPIIAN